MMAALSAWNTIIKFRRGDDSVDAVPIRMEAVVAELEMRD